MRYIEGGKERLERGREKNEAKKERKDVILVEIF